MFVCQVFAWFVIYSMVGWIWESTYCTIVEHRWQNRGFLYGPVCPIYGTGIVGVMLLWHHTLQNGHTLTWYQVFLTVMIGSAILEYTTHWALEKLFHAYWWDYSNMPLNINGRICLPASIFFGLGGLLVVYVLYEPTVRIIAQMDPLATEALALVLMAIMAADTAITAASLASIAHAASAINTSVNDHMDRFVLDVQTRGSAVAQGVTEKRDDATQAIKAAAAGAVSKAGNVAQQVEERGTLAADALARERDRFAQSLRALRLSQMGTVAKSAARRAIGAVSPERLPDSPNREQLAGLWRDMLDKS